MLNSVSIIGNLGQDVDLRYTQQGTAVANLNLAVSEFYRDQNGESQKRTHWFRATAFGRTAEIAGEYLKKGSKVGISGQLVQRTWQDDQGNNKSSIEIRINQLELIGNGGPQQQNDDNYARIQQKAAQQHFNQQKGSQASNPQSSGPPDPDPPYDYDQDIPF